MNDEGGPAARVATGETQGAHDGVARPQSGTRSRARPPRAGTLPIPPRHFVPRTRLWKSLDRSTAMGVTLLTGPVGTGKTLGIAGWLRDRGHDRDNAIWVHADAALTAPRLRSVLDRSSRGGGSVNGARGGPSLVVIDDAHELPPASVRLIDERLRTSPESMRLVLASRWDLPLTRLVPELLGHLTVLRGELLRMDDSEAATVVASHLGADDPDVVRAVVDWGDGWSAVLVLAAHAVGRSPDPAGEVRRLTRGAAPVADQVANEVFATLTVPQRHLLLCVSGEGPFSAGLAAHLSHDRHAAEILEELETTGLLVTRVPGATDHLVDDPFAVDADPAPADDRFLIHPLLREVVRRRLAVDSVDVVRARATVTRAVRLDLASGHASRALPRLVRLYAYDEAAAVLARDAVHLVLGPGHGDEVALVARAHPEIVDTHPSTWFAVALDRWLADDQAGIEHWTARILERADRRRGTSPATEAPASDQPTPAQVACARLWRAKLGLEPIGAAVEAARPLVHRMQDHDGVTGADAQALAVLLLELGIAQGWLGEFDAARTSFSAALVLCRSQELTAMAAAAMSHLALTEFMAGHDRAAAEVATEAFSMLGEGGTWRLRFAPARAGLALFLGSTMAMPWASEPAPPAFGDNWRRTHSGDLTTRFWSRARDAMLETWAGSLASARAVQTGAVDDPRLQDAALPRHLRVSQIASRAMLAALAADQEALEGMGRELVSLGSHGEARFVEGLRADCQGDRKAALQAFGEAAESAACPQPPVRAMSTACAAQLLDSLGEADAALDRLAEAATSTAVRRNGMAFLGWSRQGTPMEALLRRLSERTGSAWVQELAELTSGQADVISSFESSTALRLEQRDATGPLVGPSLSPREREVLGELARGATYADIGSRLYLSPNTVKTHVSSLYAKLGVSRRSDALAVARAHHIL